MCGYVCGPACVPTAFPGGWDPAPTVSPPSLVVRALAGHSTHAGHTAARCSRSGALTCPPSPTASATRAAQGWRKAPEGLEVPQGGGHRGEGARAAAAAPRLRCASKSCYGQAPEPLRGAAASPRSGRPRSLSRERTRRPSRGQRGRGGPACSVPCGSLARISISRSDRMMPISAALRRSASTTAKVWVDKNTKVCVQGFTGKQVRFLSARRPPARPRLTPRPPLRYTCRAPSTRSRRLHTARPSSVEQTPRRLDRPTWASPSTRR
jgi:hypothetical protein